MVPPSTRFGLIGFTGLFLVPGRVAEARAFLLGLVDRLRDGLLPTSTPETGGRAFTTGRPVAVVRQRGPRLPEIHRRHRHRPGPLLEAVLSIVKTYRHGTLLGIVAGPDGLLTTDQPGVATTWMDAQADGWVVTPRGGKAVEVNALWYNAIRIAADVADQFGGPSKASELSHFADTVQASFNAGSGTRSRAAATTCWRSRATTRRSGPINCWRSRCRTRSCPSPGSSRCWKKFENF